MDIDAKQVIERLGGNAEVAAMFEISPAAVSQWQQNGIPKARLMYIKAVRPDALTPGELLQSAPR